MKLHTIKRFSAFLSAVVIFVTPIQVFADDLMVGSSGANVKVAQQCLNELGYYNYSETGYFGKPTEDAVKSYQRFRGLTITGFIDDTTYELLQRESKEVKAIGTSDWFKEACYIFPREANAVVMDIDTGKTFCVRRTFGTNHADVEPLTVKDAEIIKSIWGGWSWDRRAVVVTVNGSRLAGSMTAFPHAGVDSKPAIANVAGRSGGYGYGQNLDSVKGNGVDGHMDIHFLNSKTHGNNVVQKVHQDMVKKADEFIKKTFIQ